MRYNIWTICEKGGESRGTRSTRERIRFEERNENQSIDNKSEY